MVHIDSENELWFGKVPFTDWTQKDMPHILFFDTETTGLLPKRFKINDQSLPNLPYLVQLGALKVDSRSYETVQKLDLLVKPEGWEIPESATKIHGIKQDYAERYGIPMEDAVSQFEEMMDDSVGIVAHNVDFDARLMSVQFARTGRDPAKIFNKPKKCTMKAAAPVCNLPGFYPGSPKWPKLEECINIMFGETLEGAHDAIVDIEATVRVFVHLKSIGAI